MHENVEVVFKGERKEIYANPQQFPFKIGDYVIVEADKGEDLGIVNQVGAILSIKKKDAELKSILRKPDPKDLNQVKDRHNPGILVLSVRLFLFLQDPERHIPRHLHSLVLIRLVGIQRLSR